MCFKVKHFTNNVQNQPSEVFCKKMSLAIFQNSQENLLSHLWATASGRFIIDVWQSLDPFTDELFECFWPFYGFGAYRVKCASIKFIETEKSKFSTWCCSFTISFVYSIISHKQNFFHVRYSSFEFTTSLWLVQHILMPSI